MDEKRNLVDKIMQTRNNIENSDKFQKLKEIIQKIDGGELDKKIITGKDKITNDEIKEIFREPAVQGDPTPPSLKEEAPAAVQSPPSKKKENKPNKTEPYSDYLKVLKEADITEDEAIKVLISVFYDNKYEIETKMMGHNIIFRLCPPEYEIIKFKILTQEAPIYKQHEEVLIGDLSLAGVIKSYDNNKFEGETPEEEFQKRFNFVRSLNPYLKISLFNKYYEFEKKIAIITSHPQAENFFEAIRERTMKSG